MRNLWLRLKNAYYKLQELGIKNEDARFVLSNAVQNESVLSANFRELRHIFCVRKKECDKYVFFSKKYLYFRKKMIYIFGLDIGKINICGVILET